MTPADSPSSLASLCGLRTAPVLTLEQRLKLLDELAPRMAACEWFTVGVMAPSAAAAVAALSSLETARGWAPLVADGEEAPEGPVFLKGNQRNGRYRLRTEAGLGEGILITGHNAELPETEDTWGPLPLDIFEGPTSP